MGRLRFLFVGLGVVTVRRAVVGGRVWLEVSGRVVGICGAIVELILKRERLGGFSGIVTSSLFSTSVLRASCELFGVARFRIVFV